MSQQIEDKSLTTNKDTKSLFFLQDLSFLYENATKQLTTIVCPDNIATSKYGKKCYKLLVFAKRQSREREGEKEEARETQRSMPSNKNVEVLGITKLYT